MLTVGGAISGYSDIGSARSTNTPAMVMMIASTAAKIGRSMKKWEKRMMEDLRVLRHGRHRCPGHDQTAGDDATHQRPTGRRRLGSRSAGSRRPPPDARTDWPARRSPRDRSAPTP